MIYGNIRALNKIAQYFMVPPNLAFGSTLIRTKGGTVALGTTRRPRSMARKAFILYQHRDTLEAPTAIEGHLTEGILIVLLVLQTNQKISFAPMFRGVTSFTDRFFS